MNELNEIREIISKYQDAKEIIENGQRFLLVNNEKIRFGYPYLTTPEKFIVRDILTLLNKVKE